MMITIYLISCFYILGSFSSAVILTRLCGYTDPRQMGSKNPGATNVYRLGYKKLALFVFALDVLKGALPLCALKLAGFSTHILFILGFFLTLGHIYPIFMNFKGGKGVATFFSVLLVIQPKLALISLFLWLIIVYFFKLSALASLIVLCSHMYYFCVMDSHYEVIPMMLLVLWSHRDNIDRLLRRKEMSIKNGGSSSS